MPEKQAVKKSNGDNLRVFKVSETEYFVESSKEKILYKVVRHNGNASCTCGDYTTNAKKDEAYQCKHILAALNGNVQNIGRYSGKPKLNDQFIINMKGKEFVLYSGLLDLAHQKGIQMLKVEPVQYPSKDNGMEAICKASLESPNGDLYVEYGDARPQNVNKMVANHILRMAATRAKARCMRDYTNIGITCLEELGGDDIPELDPEPKPSPAKKSASQKTAKSAGEVIPMKQKESSKPDQTEKPDNQQPPDQSNNQKTANSDKKQNSTAKKSESDTGEKQVSDNPKPSQAQKRAIENLAARRGLSLEDLNQLCQKTLGVEYEYLSASDAAQFIKNLQQSS
jgi:hypothetical protein